jgi:hypothetical protein
MRRMMLLYSTYSVPRMLVGIEPVARRMSVLWTGSIIESLDFSRTTDEAAIMYLTVDQAQQR